MADYDFGRQITQGHRLTLANIFYHMPDYPDLLQEFIWQDYDLAPEFPALHGFLSFWEKEIDGTLHSVYVARREIIGAHDMRHCDVMLTLQ